MISRITSFVGALATIIGALTFSLSLSQSAMAQIAGTYTYDATNNAYFIQGDTIVNGDISGNDLFIGKDNATSFTTLAGTATLTVETGANITAFGNSYPDGNSYQGINVFGANAVAVQDGVIDQVYSWNSSAVTITGGMIANVLAFDSSTIALTGSGTVSYLYGNGDSKLNISDGTISGNLTLYDTSTAIITGNNLGYVVTGAWSGGDIFTVSGNWADTTDTPFSFEVDDRNDGSGAPVGFVLQNATVVPESSTTTLLVAASILPLISMAIRYGRDGLHRKKRCVAVCQRR